MAIVFNARGQTDASEYTWDLSIASGRSALSIRGEMFILSVDPNVFIVNPSAVPCQCKCFFMGLQRNCSQEGSLDTNCLRPEKRNGKKRIPKTSYHCSNLKKLKSMELLSSSISQKIRLNGGKCSLPFCTDLNKCPCWFVCCSIFYCCTKHPD